MCSVCQTAPVGRARHTGQPQAGTHGQEQLQSLQGCSPWAGLSTAPLHCPLLLFPATPICVLLGTFQLPQGPVGEDSPVHHLSPWHSTVWRAGGAALVTARVRVLRAAAAASSPACSALLKVTGISSGSCASHEGHSVMIQRQDE